MAIHKILKNRIIVVAVLLGLMLNGCSDGRLNESVMKESSNKTKITMTQDAVTNPTKLVYYTIGNPDTDLKLVNQALNELLESKYSLILDYKKIGWNDYDSRITNLVNSGGNFDIAFVAGPGQGNYAKQAKKGAWLPLNDFLSNEGKVLYDSISPLFWEGVTIDGKIYGIPTNKEVAVPEYFMFPKELVDKYKIDTTKLNKLEDLREVFALIKEKEPEYLVMELDKNSNSFFAMEGYEYIISKEIPLMVNSKDDKLQVVNIFETETARKILDILREYYLAGYINEDAAIRSCSVLEKGKKVFWKMGSGGPYSETSWSTDRGYEIVGQQVTEAIATTESTRGSVMVVNSLSDDKEACYRFLLALNTDAEVRNLVNYGIEDVHYILDANEQVVTIDDSYTGVQYTQGNWFILNTRQGEPRDKWEIYKEFNENVVASNLLGFQADTQKLSKEIAAITTVWEKYYSGLLTGSINVDEYLPQFLVELEAAGIKKVQQELQSQIDTWSQLK